LNCIQADEFTWPPVSRLIWLVTRSVDELNWRPNPRRDRARRHVRSTLHRCRNGRDFIKSTRLHIHIDRPQPDSGCRPPWMYPLIESHISLIETALTAAPIWFSKTEPPQPENSLRRDEEF